MSRSRQDRMETPCGTGFQSDRNQGPSLSETSTLWDAHRHGINEYDDLMRCDFDEEPIEQFQQDLFAIIEEAGILTDKEQAVVNFMIVGGMSLAWAGKYLGAEFPRKGVPTPYSKTTVAQLHASALEKIRLFLSEKGITQ